MSYFRGVIIDRPICDGTCHDVFLCNLPSYPDLDSIEHLQHLTLLDHAHKISHFHGSLSLLLYGALCDACGDGILTMDGSWRLVMA